MVKDFLVLGKMAIYHTGETARLHEECRAAHPDHSGWSRPRALAAAGMWRDVGARGTTENLERGGGCSSS